ncbi:VETF-like early transcription factor large subunit [Orpheovirus IHUMI-LCC2]|uniref:VETF-like early transcription factor large subunit n=1 Tax=Orpheovirus IHUMI-LCC2 TaxID=2023057 RepID=A0A2I2L618_9VIRU|nr:VETF-like early transcription factor large subunit [Orpheovirus IHUMI-LCC2]SNW62995.1 VETF-like early transcription factor large subunit [Orpheovirus IHUMI-LCC2]
MLNKFDNDVTRLYKFAVINKTLPRYVLRQVNEDTGETTYYLLLDYLTNRISDPSFDISTELDIIKQSYYTDDRLSPYNLLLFFINKIPGSNSPRFLQQINKTLLETNTIPTADLIPQQLPGIINGWIDDYNNEFRKSEYAINSINTIQNSLDQISPLYTSPFTITHTTQVFNPTLLQPPTTSQSPSINLETYKIEIFDRLLVSYEVPYIQYNTPSGDRLFKLFKGDTQYPAPKYDLFVPTTESTFNAKDTIYIIIWKEEDESKKLTRESYTKVLYNLSLNKVEIQLPVGDEKELIISRLKSFLQPVINLGEGREVRLGGYFYIYNCEVDEYSLLHAIMNDKLFSTYLYVEESIKPYAEKKRLGLHFKSLPKVDLFEKQDVSKSSVSVTLFQNYSLANEKYNVKVYRLNGLPVLPNVPGAEEVINKGYTWPERTPVLQMTINKADNQQVTGQFIEIISRLLSYYTNPIMVGAPSLKTQIQNTYSSLIPGLYSSTGVEKGKLRSKKAMESTRLQRLQQIAPELFPSNYGRICQGSGSQPEIISDAEVEAWQAQTFTKRGVTQNRQVLQFPIDVQAKLDKKPTGHYNIVCPNDSNPYPGVKINDGSRLKNADIYPVVPCCMYDDHIGKEVKNSVYYRFFTLRESIDQISKTKQQDIIRGNKLLNPGSIGILPTAISDLTSAYKGSGIEAHMVRYGVIRSPNSFIHSLLVCKIDQNYLSLPTDEAKEEYAKGIRRFVYNNTHPNLYRQEMYDYTDKDIRDYISGEEFLDPSLAYRGFEEWMGCNIFVFTAKSNTATKTRATNGKNGNGTQEYLGYIELPRYKIFHSRYYRPDRPTILLFKHMGSESDGLKYPQCEIIADQVSEGKWDFSYRESMTKLVYYALKVASREISWNVDNNDIIARDTPYSRVRLLDVVPKSLVPASQLIDPLGKCRAIAFRGPGFNVLISTIPSMPENLPTLLSTEIRLPIGSLNTVLNGASANYITKNIDGEVDGVWYGALDIPNAFYIPIVPTSSAPSSISSLPLGPNNPLFTTGRDPINRYRKLRRVLDIFLQVVYYLYMLDHNSNNGIEFINRYGYINNENIDSLDMYSFVGIERLLPTEEQLLRGGGVDIVSAAMLYLSNTPFKSMFINVQGNIKILFHSYDLAKKVANKLRRDPNGIVPVEIVGLYSMEEDFRQDSSTAIFLDDYDMREWLRTVEHPVFQNMIIKPKLDLSYAILEDPYLYKDQQGIIYIVQNVQKGNMLKALQVSENWYQDRINTGYYTEEYDINLSYDPGMSGVPPHLVFGISPDGTLTVSSINNPNSYPQEDLLLIMQYARGNYAAMLPIYIPPSQ